VGHRRDGTCRARQRAAAVRDRPPRLAAALLQPRTALFGPRAARFRRTRPRATARLKRDARRPAARRQEGGGVLHLDDRLYRRGFGRALVIALRDAIADPITEIARPA